MSDQEGGAATTPTGYRAQQVRAVGRAARNTVRRARALRDAGDIAGYNREIARFRRQRNVQGQVRRTPAGIGAGRNGPRVQRVLGRGAAARAAGIGGGTQARNVRGNRFATQTLAGNARAMGMTGARLRGLEGQGGGNARGRRRIRRGDFRPRLNP